MVASASRLRKFSNKIWYFAHLFVTLQRNCENEAAPRQFERARLHSVCTVLAAWFWKESPVKVHLAVLNWELGCESPTVPQQWTPLWLLSINAIENSWEGAWEWRKVWRPAFFGKMPNDPRCKDVRRKHYFFGSAPFGFAALPCKDLCAYVYYYISSTGRPVVR